MHRYLLTLVLLGLPLSAHAADAIVHLDTPSQTLYVRVFTGSTTAVAVALTEGTSSGVGRYAVTEASLVSGGLGSAGAYPFKVFAGTPSTTADDTQVGQGTLYWSGAAALPAQADVRHFGGVAGTFAGGRAEVDLNSDANAEPTGAPSSTATLAEKIAYLYMMLTNKVTVTADAKTYHDAAGNAEFAKPLADDGTTYTESAAE